MFSDQQESVDAGFYAGLMMKAHEVERENLDAHISICQERYRALEHRFMEVENKIDRINDTLEQIRRDLNDLRESQHTRWNTAQIALIAVLTSTIGVLLGKIVF